MVTRYWPRIAGGLVLVFGLVELVVGGLTADSRVEFYLMAWAGTTGGLWFLFDKAETALSDEARETVLRYYKEWDSQERVGSLPDRFGLLFDQVFGERHLTRRCFGRSCVASLGAVAILWILALAVLGADRVGSAPVLGVLIAGLFYNIVPDYLSLLETRWLLGQLRRRRLALLVGLDALLTALIFWVWSYSFNSLLGLSLLPLDEFAQGMIDAALLGDVAPGFGVFFYSTFFTSAWLWLYAASVPLSALLLRMNSGVGFLLRATDVERWPFRSMGFVCVVLVSALFGLALPLVIL